MNMKFCIRKRCGQGNTKSIAWEKNTNSTEPLEDFFFCFFFFFSQQWIADHWTGTVNQRVVCSVRCTVWISLCGFCHRLGIFSRINEFSILPIVVFALASYFFLFSTNMLMMMMMIMMNGPIIILNDIWDMRYALCAMAQIKRSV